MTTSQDFVNWVCGPNLNARYLHYLLMSEQDSIRRFAHGTTHQTVYYPEAKAFYICVPGRTEQDRIVETLASLDDKIAANDRIIQQIYELIQRTWEVVAAHAGGTSPVASIAEVEKGLSYKGVGLGSGTPLINLGNFGTQGQYQESGIKYYTGASKARHRIRHDELAIANTDLTQRREILGQPLLVPRHLKEALFTHHVFAVRLKDNTSPDDVLWLYCALRDRRFRDRAITHATGTTVLALPKDAVLRYELPWPRSEARQDWTQRVRSMLNLTEACAGENKRLAELRDTLLPGLMSGEIRIREAEAVASERSQGF